MGVDRWWALVYSERYLDSTASWNCKLVPCIFSAKLVYTDAVFEYRLFLRAGYGGDRKSVV